MKILTAETDLTSATNISKSPVVRIYNSDSSAITLTRKSNAGETIGSYSVPPSKVIYCEKSYTDTLEGGAALKATGVGYSEELDIICLGNGSGSGSSFGGVTTDLYLHYDFSNTDSWNRNNSANAADYTVNNLANDYNDAVFRSRTGTSNAYRNSSESPCIDFNSSDGGGCLEWIPSNHSGDSNTCVLAIFGDLTSTLTNYWYYNATTVSSTDTNNLYNGIGTGAYTIEFWYKAYLTNSGDGQGSVWSDNPQTSTSSVWTSFRAYSGGYSTAPKKLRVDFSFNVDIAGAPSGTGWTDWNHVVYSRNSSSSNDLKIYVNNSLEHTGTNANDYDYLRSGALVSAVGNSSTNPIRQGLIRFYRGKALTASEVTTNWNAQKSRFGY